MPFPRRRTLATGGAALGHGLIFVGFLQPWVAGQFGARDRLSGLDLARLTDGLIDHGVAGDALSLPITRALLFALPLAAANALLLLALGRLGLLPSAHARHLALLLALPAAAIALAATALLLVAATEDGVVDGPAFGLLLVAAGAALAVAAWRLAGEPAEAPPPPSDRTFTEA